MQKKRERQSSRKWRIKNDIKKKKRGDNKIENSKSLRAVHMIGMRHQKGRMLRTLMEERRIKLGDIQ